MHLMADELTSMLQEVVDGREMPRQELLDVMYSELRVLAVRALKGERNDHTLQPTALVNEAYLKLINSDQLKLNGRAHFFALAASTMRKVLIDHARARNADKRGGDLVRVTLNEQSNSREVTDLLALDELLLVLKKIAPRQHFILELRFFAGLKIEEIGTVMNLSPAMIAKELKKARGWLYARLSRE